MFDQNSLLSQRMLSFVAVNAATVKAFGSVRLTPEEWAVKEVVPELITNPAQVIPFVIPNVLNVPDAVESKSNSYFPRFTPEDFNDNSKPEPTTKLLGL